MWGMGSPEILTPEDQYLEVAHASRVGQCCHTLAQDIPPPPRHLAPVGTALGICFGKLIVPASLQFVINTQVLQPQALRGECVQAQAMLAARVDQRAEIDMGRDILLAGMLQRSIIELVPRVAGERAAPAVAYIQVARSVTIVDGQDKTAPDKMSDALHPA